MEIRKYRAGEEPELKRLFFNTIRNVNIRDYTLEQVSVWAPDEIDDEKWRVRMEGIAPFVCVENARIVGYADVQTSGYIDHFYVHHEWQRQGVGSLLFSRLVEQATEYGGVTELTSEVSITARPFFESKGFQVVREQEVEVQGLILHNFKMRRDFP